MRSSSEFAIAQYIVLKRVLSSLATCTCWSTQHHHELVKIIQPSYQTLGPKDHITCTHRHLFKGLDGDATTHLITPVYPHPAMTTMVGIANLEIKKWVHPDWLNCPRNIPPTAAFWRAKGWPCFTSGT